MTDWPSLFQTWLVRLVTMIMIIVQMRDHILDSKRMAPAKKTQTIIMKGNEMAHLKIVQDLENKTLMVFFGDPGGDVHSEEIDDTTVIFRNDDGEIIGVEKLEYETNGTVVDVSVETHSSTTLPEG